MCFWNLYQDTNFYKNLNKVTLKGKKLSSKNINDKFYYDGNLHDVEISESKLKQFVNLHQNELDLLANEHIQKIQSYKQIN